MPLTMSNNQIDTLPIELIDLIWFFHGSSSSCGKNSISVIYLGIVLTQVCMEGIREIKGPDFDLKICDVTEEIYINTESRSL